MRSGPIGAASFLFGAGMARAAAAQARHILDRQGDGNRTKKNKKEASEGCLLILRCAAINVDAS
jgi:hypothetical protein